jgi:hypothetical protein
MMNALGEPNICRNLWIFHLSGSIKILKTEISGKKSEKNYNPAIRSIAPRRIPNMDVEADNIPKTI